jgi:diadenylate cyclase
MDAVRAFVLSVGPTDVLDVIATSVLIYYVLLLIRGTRAVQILIGVLVLIGLLGIANVLRLYLLGSILQIIVVGAAVTLPIVFQPELRRALEQIGRGGLFRMTHDDAERRPEDRSILAIAQVAFALSRSRIGALIVIEQQSGLKEYIESGTLLNALVSVELLVSLFQPRSPLHDGAVIVQEDLIEAAGCFLPLAEQTLAERRVGTRHRAALGLSEQTDAVVVVVSEETGAITVAREGKLSRPIEDEARLNNILLAVTRRRRTTRVTGNDLVSHLRTRLLPHRASSPPPGESRGDTSQELRT